MNEKKSNAPVVAIIAVVALFLLGVPCVLGAMFVGGLLFYRMEAIPEPMEVDPPPPVIVPEHK